MKAKIEKTFEVDHHVDLVWEYLSDPTKVVVCVPGASITEKVDEENYKGMVSMKFGPVTAKYNGEVKIDSLDKDTHEMILSGVGKDSKGKGSANMKMNGKLNVLSENKTEVNYSMEISVLGMLAQFGSRLIVDVSNQLVDQFIANFKKQLSEAAPAPEPVPAATTTAPAAEAETVAATAAATVKAAAKEASSPPPPPPNNNDNSLNVFSLLMGMLRSFLSRLFGGGSR